MKVTPEEIYAAYPRKVGKIVALKAIKKAMMIEDPRILLSRTLTYAEMIKWQERRFVPHPATWFGQGRWDDDQSEWKAPSTRISTYDTKSKLQVLDEEIKRVERKGHEDAFGLNFSNRNDKIQYQQLKKQRREISAQLLN